MPAPSSTPLPSNSGSIQKVSAPLSTNSMPLGPSQSPQPSIGGASGVVASIVAATNQSLPTLASGTAIPVLNGSMTPEDRVHAFYFDPSIQSQRAYALAIVNRLVSNVTGDIFDTLQGMGYLLSSPALLFNFYKNYNKLNLGDEAQSQAFAAVLELRDSMIAMCTAIESVQTEADSDALKTAKVNLDASQAAFLQASLKLDANYQQLSTELAQAQKANDGTAADIQTRLTAYEAQINESISTLFAQCLITLDQSENLKADANEAFKSYLARAMNLFSKIMAHLSYIPVLGCVATITGYAATTFSAFLDGSELLELKQSVVDERALKQSVRAMLQNNELDVELESIALLVEKSQHWKTKSLALFEKVLNLSNFSLGVTTLALGGLVLLGMMSGLAPVIAGTLASAVGTAALVLGTGLMLFKLGRWVSRQVKQVVLLSKLARAKTPETKKQLFVRTIQNNGDFASEWLIRRLLGNNRSIVDSTRAFLLNTGAVTDSDLVLLESLEEDQISDAAEILAKKLNIN